MWRYKFSLPNNSKTQAPQSRGNSSRIQPTQWRARARDCGKMEVQIRALLSAPMVLQGRVRAGDCARNARGFYCRISSAHLSPRLPRSCRTADAFLVGCVFAIRARCNGASGVSLRCARGATPGFFRAPRPGPCFIVLPDVDFFDAAARAMAQSSKNVRALRPTCGQEMEANARDTHPQRQKNS